MRFRRWCDGVMLWFGAPETMVGDLCEVGAERSNAWYAAQTARFVGRGLVDGIERRPVRSAWCAAILLACIGAAIVEARVFTQPSVPEALAVELVGTGWRAVADSAGKRLLVPAASLRLRNKTNVALRGVQLNAVFLRAIDGNEWGSQWLPLKGDAGVPAGDVTAVLNLASPHGHVGEQAPSDMFVHPQFQDARILVLCRFGSSGWTRVADLAVPRTMLPN